MEETKKTLNILNLTGKLSQELSNYFTSRKMSVIDPLVDSTQYEWTHVLVRDNRDFSLLNDSYQTLDKDVKIISLTKVDDLTSFVLYNGKLVLDELWLQGEIGGFILDKFFQEYAGINIEDNYPNFKEKGSFKISNPFNTGEYLDRLVFHAFEAGVNALAIKTYFDHFLMYLTGLKNKGKVGLPLEITYGQFGDIFGLQMHFFTRDLSLDDVTLCLSSSITKKPEEYLFNISVQSADFFDFTYIQGVNKVVVTGLWSQDARIEMHNRGMMFTNLSSAAAISEYPTDGASSYLLQNPELADMSSRISLPNAPLVEQELQTIAAAIPEMEEPALQTIAASLPEEEFVTTVGGGEVEEEVVNNIGGGREEDDAINKIKGNAEKPDDFSMKISGGSTDDGKGNFNVKSLGGMPNDDKGNMSVRSLGGMTDNNKGQFNVRSLGDQGGVPAQEDFALKVLGSGPEMKNAGNMNVKSLGNGNTDSLDLTSLVGSSPSKSANSLFKSPPSDKEKDLEQKLKNAIDENDKLKTKLKIVLSEAKIAKDTQNRLDDFRSRTEASLSGPEAVLEDDSAKQRAIFQQKLADPKGMSSSELEKLKAFMEKETKLIDELKAGDMKARKLQLEIIQKETLFTQELEKTQRQIATKDIILTKAKETFTKLTEKKDAEISSLKIRFDQVNKILASGASQQQAAVIHDLEKQNSNLNKIVEVYKNKIASLSASLESTKVADTDKEEVRRLNMSNMTLKNQLDTTRRELQKIQERAGSETNLLMTLKQDKVKLEQSLKKALSEASRGSQSTGGQNFDAEVKRYQSQNQILEVQVKETTIKMRDLEKRLIDAQKAPKLQVQAGEENSKAKVTHLETSMKKITADLIASQNAMAEMKKETNKLRQEKISLQNTVDKQKKDLEKFEKNKPAAPKPGSTGGKAA